MKEERMVILRMLENGIITAEEAKELLGALQKEGSGKDLFNKAGDMLKILATKAKKMEPKVKETAEKAAQKATVAMEDAKNYMEHLRQKRQGNEYSWEDDEFDEEECEDVEVVVKEQKEKKKEESEEAKEDFDCVEEADIRMKNLEGYMNTVEMQMNQLDEAEAFLRGSFGNPDDAEWMDDETEEKTEAKVEENKVGKNKTEENIEEA